MVVMSKRGSQSGILDKSYLEISYKVQRKFLHLGRRRDDILG